MSLVIFGDSFTFPDGTAATNHVYTHARGFSEHGINVHIVCFENEYLENYDGIRDGIRYYHPFAQKSRSPYFLARRWQKFMKYIRAYRIIREINRNDKIISINLWTFRFATQLFGLSLAKIFKTKLLIDSSEHPLRNFKDNSLSQSVGRLRLGLERGFYDGIFCISNYLIEFYKKAGFAEKKLFLVPSTVDTARFNIEVKSPLPYDYIAYCGSLTVMKDGVDILIESFSMICEKHKNINLVLIGAGDTIEEEKYVRNLVKTLKLESRIIFLGLLPRTEVPGYLLNAKILALARPKSKVADAGFPSKLTEYLSTGNPVVVTRVGEIPYYLKDNEHAFLAEPDNAENFAGRLEFVLNNYSKAKLVGEKGKELTRTIFNYNFQAKRMLTFIKSL
ncbi:MAG: glycosyltransferase family 4 protein [Bacteroidales bacterium]|nr:glycosyltransferase family 4 protein [Bacteroidales bacterium]